MKISEAFDKYVEIKIIGRGCSPRTVEHYHYSKINAIRYFGDIKVSRLTPELLAKYYTDLIETDAVNSRRHTSGTARGEIYCLRSILAYCARLGIKTPNIDDIAAPKEKAKPVRWLERDEVEQFIENVSVPCRGYPKINIVRNELIMRLLFTSGIRVGELVALNRDSIKNGQFVVTGKSKYPRPCFITKEISDLIEEYLSMRQDNNIALFVSNQNPDDRLSAAAVRDIFRRNCRRCGIKGVHPHTMRHSFATYMLSSGANIREVADLLGHQSIQTTQKYTHIKNKNLQDLHQRIMA